MTLDISQVGFGRIKSTFDEQDYALARYEPRVYDLTGEMKWLYRGLCLNQGNKPHCGGFGLAGWGINDPVQDAFTNADGDRFYYMAKEIDGQPLQENGTSVRTMAKVGQKIGRIKNYAFAFTTNEISYWLLHNGPVMVGTAWTYDMMNPDKDNIVHITGGEAGGHFYFLNAKLMDDYYLIHNSWGAELWGINGEAKISIADFAVLLRQGGESIAAVEQPLDALPEPSGCEQAVEAIRAFFSVPAK